MVKVHLEAQEDDGILQDLLSRETDARLEVLRARKARETHTEKNTEDRATDDGEELPEDIGGNGEEQSVGDSSQILAFHDGKTSPLTEKTKRSSRRQDRAACKSRRTIRKTRHLL